MVSQSLIAQSGEFEQFPNGLIYSENTMNKLSHIVDSLNIKYKNCDLTKTFYSKSQTIGHRIKLDEGDIIEARKNIEEGMSFLNFKEKYKHAKIDENVLVVRYKYKNYDDEDVVEFSEISLNSGYGFKIIKDKKLNNFNETLKSNWIYDYTGKTEYWNESIEAFYFPEEFKAVALSEKYAKMIGYADCLIDTTATKFKENLNEDRVELPKNWTELSTNKQANLLEEMRGTRVVGFCSQDNRPREHAINIAMLSAETANWEVFLRAHLDIMNDRFERASDGSYAYGQRKTYIKELEELDINVNDLILGICLRIGNPSKNHYYGSISRIGRALSETKNKDEIENNLLSMIDDNTLDDYNRVLAYFLYDNYIYNLENEELKAKNIIKLKKSVSSLPYYLSQKIEN